MQAPEFWHRPSLLGRLLSPLGLLFEAGGMLRRMLTATQSVDIPVICVGNLIAGGAGKTPLALALAGLLQARGLKPHFLTRGYGGLDPGPVLVDPARHDFRQVGDEALLLAERAPTWVARDRAAGAKMAEAAGADLIVMDDGFQNPGLKQDLSLLVIDAGYGFGNGKVIPAGPLRESVSAGLARAHAVILVGDGAQPPLSSPLPVIRANLKPVDAVAISRAKRVLAFAGIGRPAKFFDSLRAIGVDIAETRSFPDHHVFSDQEIADILDRAKTLDAVSITTTKDWIRLSKAARAQMTVFPVELAWQRSTDETAMATLLNQLFPAS